MGGMGRGRQRNQQAQEQRGGFNLFYFFLLIFAAYSLAPLFQSKPSFSTSPTGDHKFRVTTSELGV